MKSGTPLPDIITGAFGTMWGSVYLWVVTIAIFVCLLSIQAASIRLMFSMSRDDRLPFSRVWARVNPNRGTPIFELSVALLLIVGGLYWLGVQRHRSEPETGVVIPETGTATTVGGP